MKTTTIKASLMLEDTLKFPLMLQDVEITYEDFKKGMEYVTKIAQIAMLDRLTVIIDEEKLMETFGEVPILKG